MWNAEGGRNGFPAHVPTPHHEIAERRIDQMQLYTAAPVEAPATAPVAIPVWIRLPKSGHLCPYTGLSRSALNALILGQNAPVKSVSLKKRYAVRGVRLIHLQALLDYVAGEAAAQNSTGTNSGASGSEQPNRLPSGTEQ